MSRAIKYAHVALIAGSVCFFGYICFAAASWTTSGGFASSTSWSGSFSGDIAEIGWPRTYLGISTDRNDDGTVQWTVQQFGFSAMLINCVVFLAATWLIYLYGRAGLAHPAPTSCRYSLRSLFVAMVLVSTCAAYWRYTKAVFDRETAVIERLEVCNVEVACGDHSPLILRRLLSDRRRDIFLRAEELYLGAVKDESALLRIANDLGCLKHVHYISLEAHSNPGALLKLTQEFPGSLTISLRGSGVSDESLRALRLQDNIETIILPDAP